MMHKGTFRRAAIRARKRILVHHRAETLRAEKIGALSDPNRQRSVLLHLRVTTLSDNVLNSVNIIRRLTTVNGCCVHRQFPSEVTSSNDLLNQTAPQL